LGGIPIRMRGWLVRHLDNETKGELMTIYIVEIYSKENEYIGILGVYSCREMAEKRILEYELDWNDQLFVVERQLNETESVIP
jgi:hypothetical protein